MSFDPMTQGRSAYLAIVGRPNVGKSSLLNKLVGEKIAIVSKKPQTTRNRIMGVLNHGEDQLVFLDTPGLLKPRNALGEYMSKAVAVSVAEVDACLLVAEAGAPLSPADEDLMERFRQGHIPAVLALNKTDLLGDKSKMMEQIARFAERFEFRAVVPVSARTGDGLDELLGELLTLTQPGGWLFDEDTLTDQPEQKIVSERVREKVLRLTEKEVPHGVAAITDRFEEKNGALYVDVTLYCERENHKGILIGKGGGMLKKIGTDARLELERFFGCPVHLQLWVKVREDWRQRPQILQSLGYDSRQLDPD